MTEDTQIGKDEVGDTLKAKSRVRKRLFRDTARAEGFSRAGRNDLAPKLELVTLTIGELRPASRRVRRSMAPQLARIRNSILEHGFTVPIYITTDHEIIDGHDRLEAARQLGLEEVPCVVVPGTPAQIRTLRIAINRIAERGTWDFQALQIEFSELLEIDTAIEVTGFEPPQIDQIILGDPEVTEDGPVAPDPGQPGIAQSGDIWRLGKHLVACGDARDPTVYERLMGFDAIRAVFTDVPFNVAIDGHVSSGGHREFVMAAGEMTPAEFAAFNLDWINAVLPHLMDGGLLATFIDWRSIEVVLAAGRNAGLTLLNIVIWAKSNAGMGSLWRSQHEMLPVFKNGHESHLNNVELGRHGRHRSNLWEYPGASTMGSDARKGLKFHPTVKPVAMLEDALLDVTAIGEIVFDPFLGSGSTLIAAQKTGRVCRGIELDPLYVDVILRRWFELTGTKPERVAGYQDAQYGARNEADSARLPSPKPRLRIAAGRREG